MACHYPLQAFQPIQGGKLIFDPTKAGDARPIEIRCGRCLGCRLARAKEWSVRLQHEQMMHDSSSFVTLTYADEHLPPHGALQYSDVQKFFRRLRKAGERFRYFVAGEYGSELRRPHYHVLLFGPSWTDRLPWHRSANGEMNFISERLTRLWGHGHTEVADVTPANIAYTARYCLEKAYSREDQSQYERGFDPATGEVIRVPSEFIRMSLKPGIGGNWYSEFSEDLHRVDSAIARGGVRSGVPRYYQNRLRRLDAHRAEEIEVEREARLRSVQRSQGDVAEESAYLRLEHFHGGR